MKPHPTLQTERLILREFTMEDASDVQRLAGDREVARTMRHIPHPYEAGMVKEWISTLRPAFNAGERLTFAMVLREEETLIGCIILRLNASDENAGLGYWIGKPYWGQGYCTEAARELVRYGFEDLGLHRIHANHFSENSASGEVLRKVGMSYEGTRLEHYKRWGVYEDCVDYGLLARDWREAESG